jgi:hypothetical protein
MFKFLEKLFHRHTWFEWREIFDCGTYIFSIPHRRCTDCQMQEYWEVTNDNVGGYLVETGGYWKKC